MGTQDSQGPVEDRDTPGGFNTWDKVDELRRELTEATDQPGLCALEESWERLRPLRRWDDEEIIDREKRISPSPVEAFQ